MSTNLALDNSSEVFLIACQNFARSSTSEDNRKRILKGIANFTTPQREAIFRFFQEMVDEKTAFSAWDSQNLDDVYDPLRRIHADIYSTGPVVNFKDEGCHPLMLSIIKVWRAIRDWFSCRISDEQILRNMEACVSYYEDLLKVDNVILEAEDELNERRTQDQIEAKIQHFSKKEGSCHILQFVEAKDLVFNKTRDKTKDAQYRDTVFSNWSHYIDFFKKNYPDNSVSYEAHLKVAYIYEEVLGGEPGFKGSPKELVDCYAKQISDQSLSDKDKKRLSSAIHCLIANEVCYTKTK